MITRIFVDHGFNPGKNTKNADQFNRSGYWENQDLKRFARANRKPPYKAILSGDNPRLYEDVKDVLPSSPWVQKVDAFCWPAFKNHDCVVIKLKRRMVNILHSCLKTPFMNRQGYSTKEWGDIIEAHFKELDALPGYEIDTDELVEGNDYPLKVAIEACGIKYQKAITENVLSLPACGT